MNNKMMGAIIGASLGLLALFALTPTLASQYSDAQNVAFPYESVDTTEEWEQAIASASGYTIANDSIEINNDTVVDTVAKDTSDFVGDRLNVEATGVSGEVTVNLVDNSTDSTIDSFTLTDNETQSVDVSSYSADSYYLQYDTGTSGSATVDSYAVEEHSDLQGGAAAGLVIVFLVFFLGVAMAIYESLI